MMLAEALAELNEDTRLVRAVWGGEGSPFHLAISAKEDGQTSDGLDVFAYIGADNEELQVLCYTITQTDMLALDWRVVPVRE